MSQIQMPRLITRASKGAPMTAADHEHNMNVIRDFSNSLSSLYGVSFNTDGTLKDDTVGPGAIMDRAVSADDLQLNAVPFYVDEGPANHPKVTVTVEPPTSYEDGMWFLVYMNASNTAACTFEVNDLGDHPLQRISGQSLKDGDLQAGSAVAIVFYNNTWRLIAGGGTGSGTGDVTTQLSGFTTDMEDNTIPAWSGGSPVPLVVSHTLGLPTRVTVSLYTADGDATAGYTAGHVIPIEQVVSADTDGDHSITTFSVVFKADEVTVERLADVFYCAGNSTALTESDWKIRVAIEAITSVEEYIQSPTSFTCGVTGRPLGGGILRGRTIYMPWSESSTTTHLTKADIDTRAIEEVMSAGGGAYTWNKIQSAVFRADDKTDWLYLWGDACCARYEIGSANPLATVAQHSDMIGLDYCALVSVDDDTTLDASPKIYGIEIDMAMGNHLMKFADTSLLTSGDYTHSAWPVNLLNGSIVNYAELGTQIPSSPFIKSVQWNPVKGRLYVMDHSYQVYIYELDLVTYPTIQAFYADISRDYTKLTFVKTIVPPVAPISRLNIEIDLYDGEEQSVCYTRNNEVHLLPWTE